MQKTIYYPEGLPVRTGDIVWNNEGGECTQSDKYCHGRRG